MPAADFYECMIYERLEPFGDLRSDIQAGIIASTFANIHRGKDDPPYSAVDFMPRFMKPEPEPQTPEQQLKIMLALQAVANAQHNGG